MGAPFPKKEEFTYKAIKEKMENSKYNKKHINLFIYYSQHHALIPNELMLDII